MYGASENDGVIALVCVLDTYYLGGGEMEEHIIIRMLKLRFTKNISLDNNRWCYVTPATIYEFKEKIISNITSFYYKVQ